MTNGAYWVTIRCLHGRGLQPVTTLCCPACEEAHAEFEIVPEGSCIVERVNALLGAS